MTQVWLYLLASMGAYNAEPSCDRLFFLSLRYSHVFDCLLGGQHGQAVMQVCGVETGPPRPNCAAGNGYVPLRALYLVLLDSWALPPVL